MLELFTSAFTLGEQYLLILFIGIMIGGFIVAAIHDATVDEDEEQYFTNEEKEEYLNTIDQQANQIIDLRKQLESKRV